jgi:hypothetical protein
MQGFTIDVAEKMPWNNFMSVGYFYQTEFKFYCRKIPFCEVPFSHYGGATSLNVKSIIEALFLLFKIRTKQHIVW